MCVCVGGRGGGGLLLLSIYASEVSRQEGWLVGWYQMTLTNSIFYYYSVDRSVGHQTAIGARMAS